MPYFTNTSGKTITVGRFIFPAGTTVNVSSFAAQHPGVQRLLESVALPADPTPTPAASGDSTIVSSDAAREAVFRAAVGALHLDDPDHWTRDGRPDVSELNALLTEGVHSFSAAERDELWRKMNE